MLIKKLKGMRVISQEEGAELGEVAYFIFDPAKHRLTALAVHRSGLPRQESWAPVEAVKKIGEDVVFVQARELLLTQLPAGWKHTELNGKMVCSLDGRMLGSVQDLEFEPGTWQVTALLLNTGRLVLVGGACLFGPDVILAPAEAVQEPAHPSEPEKTGDKPAEKGWIKNAIHVMTETLGGSVAKLPKSDSSSETKGPGKDHFDE